jgi:hypothetical protein
MRSHERRNSPSQVVNAFERGMNAGRRQEDERLWKEEKERQRILDESRRLENLKRHKEDILDRLKTDDLIERQRKDRAFVPASGGYSRRVSYFDDDLSTRRDSRRESYLNDDLSTRRNPRYDDTDYLFKANRRNSVYH